MTSGIAAKRSRKQGSARQCFQYSIWQAFGLDGKHSLRFFEVLSDRYLRNPANMLNVALSTERVRLLTFFSSAPLLCIEFFLAEQLLA